jgi:hypothetical protein
MLKGTEKIRKHFNRIIIGTGTSAAVYLCYYPREADEDVAVIGGADPWSRRGSHRMGQPPQLLELPMDTGPNSSFSQAVRSSKFEAPVTPLKAPSRVPRLESHYTPLAPSKEAPEGPFLSSSRYAATVAEIVGPYKPIKDTVTKVSGGNPFTVELGSGTEYTAKSVIVASGPGSARSSKAYNPAYDKQTIFISGEAFLDEEIPVAREGLVCVEGGSATAAWAVEKALRGGAEGVFWFTRPGPEAKVLEERFAAAFPAGGRNDWLLKSADKIVWSIGEVVSSAHDGKRIAVTFKNGMVVTCDQYVAALGAAGGLNYIEEGLRGTLEPVIDDKGHLDLAKKAVLGLANSDKTLLAVGPVLYEKHKNYADANQILPRAARPPEGIPTIIATIGALRRYLGGGEGKWVDFNLKSFADLDEYFVNTVGFFLAANVDREQLNIAGYSIEQVARFVSDQIAGTRVMKSSTFGVTEDELSNVFDQIWDFAYKHLGSAREAEWKPMLDAYYK